MTPPTDDLLTTFFGVLHRLEDAGIAYMVVGSMASMLFGEPRLTHDLDLVVELAPRDALRLNTLFPAEDFYCPPIEIIQSEITSRGQFNLIHHDSGLKIDLILRKDTPHGHTEFNRRARLPFVVGHEAWVASPEDVIIKKLEYFRIGGSEKHLKDIRGILSETPTDDAYLKSWVDRLGLVAEWSRVTPGAAEG
jgi:hypothetical protein